MVARSNRRAACSLLRPHELDLSVGALAAEADPMTPLIEQTPRVDLRRLTVLCISGRKVG
jgi:hypothetical protein